MALRTGSLSSELAQEDPGLLEMLLEDYKLSRRRDRSSRMDFAAGWLAAVKRMARTQLQARKASEVLPW